MKRLQFPLAIGLLALFASACDTTEIPAEPPGGRIVTNDTAGTRILLTFGTPDTLRFSDYFFHTYDRTITYSAVASTDAVVLEVAGGLLRILPQHAGHASIEIRASDASGLTSSITFDVDVLGCPVLPEGSTSYFPLAPGQTWTFDYLESTTGGWPEVDSETSGTLRWTVQRVRCAPTETTFEIEEHFEGRTVTRQRTEEGEDVTETPKSWTRTLPGELSGDSLALTNYFASPGLELQATWRHPATLPDTVRFEALLHAGFGVVETARAELVRNRGLVSWGHSFQANRMNLSDQVFSIRRRDD